jgi:hypothetical protein
LITRLTVFLETPDSRATSLIVGLPVRRLPRPGSWSPLLATLLSLAFAIGAAFAGSQGAQPPSFSRHPGLDPGSMNTAVDQPGTAVFMDSGFRRNDEVLVRRRRYRYLTPVTR